MLDKPIYIRGHQRNVNRSPTQIDKMRFTPRRASMAPNSVYNQMTLFSESNDPSSPILRKRKSMEYK